MGRFSSLICIWKIIISVRQTVIISASTFDKLQIIRNIVFATQTYYLYEEISRAKVSGNH